MAYLPEIHVQCIHSYINWSWWADCDVP